MSQELDYGKFWLPPEFLTDDDVLASFRTSPEQGGFRFRFMPPVESIETESDEDDIVLRLNHDMRKATLIPEEKMYGSPQSTLCPNWDFIYAAAEELARIKMAAPPPVTPFYAYKSQNEARLAFLRLQSTQRMKQQQIMRLRVAKLVPPAPEPWPIMQNHSVPAAKTHRNGTGVFIPRFAPNTTKKQAILPDKPAYKENTQKVMPILAKNQEIKLPNEWIY